VVTVSSPNNAGIIKRADAGAWTTASLGPRILRAETAVLAALALLSMAWAAG